MVLDRLHAAVSLPVAALALAQLAEHVAFGIELIAILVVTTGTLEAVAAAVRMLVTGRSDTVRREAMVRYARRLAMTSAVWRPSR